MILYFERGHPDATEEDDFYQCVGVDVVTLEVVDDESLYFESDIPFLNWGIDTVNDLIEKFKQKGWKVL